MNFGLAYNLVSKLPQFRETRKYKLLSGSCPLLYDQSVATRYDPMCFSSIKYIRPHSRISSKSTYLNKSAHNVLFKLYAQQIVFHGY
jgi:hypothetical protein